MRQRERNRDRKEGNLRCNLSFYMGPVGALMSMRRGSKTCCTNEIASLDKEHACFSIRYTKHHHDETLSGKNHSNACKMLPQFIKK